MRWRALWRTVPGCGDGFNALPEGSPATLRDELVRLSRGIAGDEIRVIERRGDIIDVFHVTIADLMQWDPDRSARPRILEASPWLLALRRESDRQDVEDEIRSAFCRACAMGLWSRATMREVIEYCLVKLGVSRIS